MMSLQQQEKQQPPRQRRRSSHESIRSLFSDAAGVSAGRRPTFSDDSSTGSATNVDSLLCGGEQETKLQIREAEAEGSGATVANLVKTEGVASAPLPPCSSSSSSSSNSSSQGSSIDKPSTSTCTAVESSFTTPPDLQLGLDLLLNANHAVSQRRNNVIEGLGQEFTMPLARPAYTTATTSTSSPSSSSRRGRLHAAPTGTFQDRRQRHVQNEFYLACVDESFFLDGDDSDDHNESDGEDDIIGGRREEKEDFERRRQRTQRNEHHMAIADDLLWLMEEESDSDSYDEDSIA